MAYAVFKKPYIVYDGTNSADVLAMVQTPASNWAILSEADGVLTLGFAELGETFDIATGQYVLADSAAWASSIDVYDATDFTARYLTIS